MADQKVLRIVSIISDPRSEEPTITILIDRGLASGRLDQIVLTREEAIKRASQLLEKAVMLA